MCRPRMQVRRLDAAGKLQGQQLALAEAGQSPNIINSTATPNLCINTLYIADSRQGVSFLIDTGADVSDYQPLLMTNVPLNFQQN